jgi:hypothetical protein
MWTTVEAFARLEAAGRWDVEAIAGSPQAVPDSAYPLVRLGELVRESREALEPRRQPDRPFNYVGLEHVEPLTGDLVGFAPRLGGAIRSRSKIFRAGYILYGRLRPSLNKVYLAREPVAEGVCSGEFFVLVPDAARLRPLLLRHTLAAPYVVEHLARRQSGAALPRVALADLLDVRVPLPPAAHQAHMEARLAAAEAKRRRLRQEWRQLPAATTAALLHSYRQGRPVSGDWTRPPRGDTLARQDEATEG